MKSAFDPMVLIRFCGQFRLARNPIFLVQSGQFGLGLPRPLMAESGPSILWILGHLNVRFREKQTFRNIPKIFTKLTNLERPLLPSEADIKLILVKRSANDPKRTVTDIKGEPSSQNLDHHVWLSKQSS